MSDAPRPALGELARLATEAIEAQEAAGRAPLPGGFPSPEFDAHEEAHVRRESAERALAAACSPAVILRLVALATGGAEDTARLDYLASITGDVDQTICPPGNHGATQDHWLLTHESPRPPYVSEWHAPTLRETIDAARSLAPERPADA